MTLMVRKYRRTGIKVSAVDNFNEYHRRYYHTQQKRKGKKSVKVKK